MFNRSPLRLESPEWFVFSMPIRREVHMIQRYRFRGSGAAPPILAVAVMTVAVVGALAVSNPDIKSDVTDTIEVPAGPIVTGEASVELNAGITSAHDGVCLTSSYEDGICQTDVGSIKSDVTALLIGPREHETPGATTIPRSPPATDSRIETDYIEAAGSGRFSGAWSHTASANPMNFEDTGGNATEVYRAGV